MGEGESGIYWGSKSIIFLHEVPKSPHENRGGGKRKKSPIYSVTSLLRSHVWVYQIKWWLTVSITYIIKLKTSHTNTLAYMQSWAVDYANDWSFTWFLSGNWQQTSRHEGTVCSYNAHIASNWIASLLIHKFYIPLRSYKTWVILQTHLFLILFL